VVVSGIYIHARHTKPSAGDPQGGIKRVEAPIHVSNVAHVDPRDGKATRIGFKTDDKGRKIRIAKRSGESIDARRGRRTVPGAHEWYGAAPTRISRPRCP
jgi:large subunit ribosomal protein L24